MKKARSIALAVCFMLLISIAALTGCGQKETVSPVARRTDKMVEEFAAALCVSGSPDYQVFDRAGEDVTEQFLNDVQGFVKSEEWDKVNAYCEENSLLLVQHLSTQTEKIGALEERKTEVQRCIAFVHSVNAWDGQILTKKVIYDLTGHITYNPNTGIISDAEASFKNIILQDGCSQHRSNSKGIIKANKYSAEIVGEMTIAWNTDFPSHGYPVGEDIVCEPARHSFIMAGEPS